jgi:hypothetical protein
MPRVAQQAPAFVQRLTSALQGISWETLEAALLVRAAHTVDGDGENPGRKPIGSSSWSVTVCCAILAETRRSRIFWTC